ncbi:MAG: acyclic terpene utilization AtuA family protein [Endozoicomonas sp.]
MKKVRIGCGAGFSGDRIEPAAELAEKGGLQYLVFECLAERTIALAHQARMLSAESGYDPLLEARFHAVLETCVQNGICIITNMGAANPEAAARRVVSVAGQLGLSGLKVAIVTGDDVSQLVLAANLVLDDIGLPVQQLGDRFVSANAYLGSAPLVQALAQEPDVIITGRVADPSLFLAPMIHEFGWTAAELLGRGTIVGHLLECAGQVTGGYFADPGLKDVAGLARLGFPLAEVCQDGSAIITKAENTGGKVTVATCKEQLLYEIHNPSAYLTPDVSADFRGVSLAQEGADRVYVTGGGGHAAPETLKVSVSYQNGFHGEGQISYAGSGARARAQLALAIIQERLNIVGIATESLRFDLIGSDSLHGPAISDLGREPYEVRVRVAAHTLKRQDAIAIGNEIEALYTNGPAGGGGAVKSVKPVITMDSAAIDRCAVKPQIHYLET